MQRDTNGHGLKIELLRMNRKPEKTNIRQEPLNKL